MAYDFSSLIPSASPFASAGLDPQVALASDDPYGRLSAAQAGVPYQAKPGQKGTTLAGGTPSAATSPIGGVQKSGVSLDTRNAVPGQTPQLDTRNAVPGQARLIPAARTQTQGVSNPPDGGAVRTTDSPYALPKPQDSHPFASPQPADNAPNPPSEKPSGPQAVPASVQPGGGQSTPQSRFSRSPIADQMGQLEAQRTAAQGAAPQLNDPNHPEYKPSLKSRFLRGVEGVGLGLAEGGLRGAIAGGIAPQTTGLSGYRDPSSAFNRASAANQKQVGDLDQQLAAGKQQAATADQESQTSERNALGDKAEALAASDKPITLTKDQAAKIGHPELEGMDLPPRAYQAMAVGAAHDATKVTTTGMNNDTSKANTDTRTASNESVAQARDKTQRLLGELRASVSTANNERTNQTHLTTSGMRAAGGSGGQPGNYKVPADVTKRAALANNVQENAGEVSKLLDSNPNLVGAVAGRYTNTEQMIGNDDPAISALGTRIHNIALAANGAHGVRSQEAVHATEKEILNNFHNGPNAIKGALNATTTSVQTFLDDEKNFRSTGGRVLPSTPSTPSAAAPPSGKEVSLAAAKALPQNKDKSDADIRKDIEAHGHRVKE